MDDNKTIFENYMIGKSNYKTINQEKEKCKLFFFIISLFFFSKTRKSKIEFRKKYT